MKPRLAHGAFAGKDLSCADLRDADLSGADLSQSVLRNTDLGGADLSRAKLGGAILEAARLQETILRGADLSDAVLTGADLAGADLTDVNFNECDLSQARITNCIVYGISAWNTRLEHALQSNLRLSRSRDAQQRVITVDSVQTAVVVNLLLESGGLPALIDALCSKTVLVVRRLPQDKEGFWDALKEELFNRNYVAISFDFEKPTSRSLHETLMLLASLSRFIIADVGDSKSVPYDLLHIIPQLGIPIIPLIERSQTPLGMFVDLFQKYDWVLQPSVYAGTHGVSQLVGEIVDKAEAKIRARAEKFKAATASLDSS
jgi:hypothetical protein